MQILTWFCSGPKVFKVRGFYANYNRIVSKKCNHSFDNDFTYLVGTYIYRPLQQKKVDPKYWLEKMQFIDSRVFCNMLEIAYLYFCGNSNKTSAL